MKFSSQNELMAHAQKAHAKSSAVKCNCGGSFPTQEALAAHAKIAHAMR